MIEAQELLVGSVYDYSTRGTNVCWLKKSDDCEARKQKDGVNKVKRWLVHLRFESSSVLRAGRLFLPKILQIK